MGRPRKSQPPVRPSGEVNFLDELDGGEGSWVVVKRQRVTILISPPLHDDAENNTVLPTPASEDREEAMTAEAVDDDGDETRTGICSVGEQDKVAAAALAPSSDVQIQTGSVDEQDKVAAAAALAPRSDVETTTNEANPISKVWRQTCLDVSMEEPNAVRMDHGSAPKTLATLVTSPDVKIDTNEASPRQPCLDVGREESNVVRMDHGRAPQKMLVASLALGSDIEIDTKKANPRQPCLGVGMEEPNVVRMDHERVPPKTLAALALSSDVEIHMNEANPVSTILRQPCLDVAMVEPNAVQTDHRRANPKTPGVSNISKIIKRPRMLPGLRSLLDGRLLLNQTLRATLIERKLEKAGGLSNWLGSIGLGQFETIFHSRSVGKYQLVNLTMNKLKDMGVDAVGPRRKLMHAIDCICQPYCFGSK